MPRYTSEHKGKTYHFDWNEKRKPTQDEVNQIIGKLIADEAEQEYNSKEDELREQYAPLNPLKAIKEGPIGRGMDWLFSSPEFIEEGKQGILEEIEESPGGLQLQLRPGDERYEELEREGQRDLAKNITEFAAPTRFDIGAAGAGLAVKPVMKALPKVGRSIEEFGKFLSKPSELGNEAGVLKIGSNAAELANKKGLAGQSIENIQNAFKDGKLTEEEALTLIQDRILSDLKVGSRKSGTNPRELGTNPRAIKAAEEQHLDEIVDLIASGEDDIIIAQKLNLKPGTIGAIRKKHGIASKDKDIEDAVERLAAGEEEIKLMEPEIEDIIPPSSNPPPPPPGSGGNIPPIPPDEPPIHKYGGGREPFRLKDLTDLGGKFQRSLQSMGEMSFPFRQGRVALAAHPSHIPSVFKGMFKGFRDPGYADEVVNEIYKRPFANIEEFADLGDELEPVKRNLYSEAKLGISNPEDIFPSNLAHQIPGLAQLSKRSEAAYGIGADTLRANLFDQVLAKHGFDLSNLPDEDTTRQLGNYVNTVTGFGRGGKTFEGTVPALQYLLYSPRYQKSQIDLLNPVNYTGATKRFGTIGAKEMAKDVTKFGTVTGGALAGADYALGDKADVEWNPFNTDFAKLKIGDTRLDPVGPLGSYPRFGLKMANDFAKRNFGDSYTESADDIIGEENVDKNIDPLWEGTKLARQKLAPGLPSFLTDMTFGKGKNVIGQELKNMPFSFPGLAREKEFETPYLGYMLNQNSPLYWQDMGDIEDPLAASIAGPAGFFGVGTQTYKEREKKPKGPPNPYDSIDRLYKKLYGR